MHSTNNESSVTYQSNLMSPPMTPKATTHNDAVQSDNSIILLSSAETNGVDINDDQRKDCLEQLDGMNDSSECSSSLLHRKASLPHSIRAMTLANHDPFDTIGRRFSIPLEKQQRHYFQHKQQCIPRRRSHRTKSLPRRSPTLANTSSHEIFTINVFDRPPTSSPATNSSTMKLHHSHHRPHLSSTAPLSTSLHSISPSSVTVLPLPSILSNSISQSTSSPISPATSVQCIPSSSSSSSTSTSSTPSSSSSSISVVPSTTSSATVDVNINKIKADTFFYDHVNLSLDDQHVYNSSWRPLWESIDKKPSVRVVWKGSPLSIQSLPYFDHLHPKEKTMASTLRLTPEQYLKCKRALILSAQVFYENGLPFRKSDAQKVCRIDVNKTSSLWGAFNRLGWLLPR